MKSCCTCGRQIRKDQIDFCNDECKEKHLMLQVVPEIIPEFSSYAKAAKHFKRDSRGLKKYENILFKINRDVPSQNIRLKQCTVCLEYVPSAKCRQKYCKSCALKGEGRKRQGIAISKQYKGENNPNYLHGKSKTHDCSTKEWKQVRTSLNSGVCELTNLTTKLECHHIIPRWFCKLAGIDIFDPQNLILLNHDYHKVIHHLKLEILLLPILYFLYKKDAPQLRKYFLGQLKFHKVHLFPVETIQELHCFQIARLPGKKKLLRLLPQFLPPFYTRPVC